MTEKVLFEYRAERGAGGYRYEFRSGERCIEIRSPAHLGGIACNGSGWKWAQYVQRACRHRGTPSQAVRNTLDALERMYRDIYGREADEFEEAG